MNYKLNKSKNLILLGVAIFILSVTFSIGFDNFLENFPTASNKPLFGADEFEYKAPSATAAQDALSSKINIALIIFGILVVVVIGLLVDIKSLTSKLTGGKDIDGNKINKWLMLFFMFAFLGLVTWEYINHGKFILLGNAASQHGETYDSMFRITLILTTIVFFATQILLFLFAFLYSYSEKRKGLYYSHNNVLEIIWTSVPFVVLTILVVRGHQTWNAIMYADEEGNATKIEVFAYQFGWNARYAGKDGELGKADYKFISESNNKLGIAYEPAVNDLLVELDSALAKENRNLISLERGMTYASAEEQYKEALSLRNYKLMETFKKEMEAIKNGEKREEIEASIYRKNKQKERILTILADKSSKSEKNLYTTHFNNFGADDIITQEIHLVKGKLVTFKFRSRDIIHSAWLPHFRTQMNVVPGLPTKISFIPTQSTKDAKKLYGDDFDYYMYCNKICGSSHFNMKMKVIVQTQDEYNKWLESQPVAFKQEDKKDDSIDINTVAVK